MEANFYENLEIEMIRNGLSEDKASKIVNKLRGSATFRHLLTVEELLKYPLPEFNIVDKKSGSSIVSNVLKPSKITDWDLNKIQREIDSSQKLYHAPNFRITTPISNEKQLVTQFLNLIWPIFDQILPRTDFEFMNPDCQHLRKGYFAQNSMPDVALIKNRERAVLPIEIKLPFVLNNFESERLGAINNQRTFSVKNKNNIDKLYTCMLRNNNKYGVLTCIEESWFFMINSLDNKFAGELSISTVVDKDQLMLELYKVVELAKDDPPSGLDIPQLYSQIPPNSPGNNGSDRSDRDRSPHRNNDKFRGSRSKNDPRRSSYSNQNYDGKGVRKMTTFAIDWNNCVGQGRSGNVYRAVANGQVVAVKYCTDPDLFGEMANEAAILAHLNQKKCPNVPNLLHAYQRDQEYFIITSFNDGVHVNFDERKSEIEKALKEIHKRHVLHGDIKENNFLVTSTGKIYVIDFGFSKITSNKSDLESELNSLRADLGLKPLRN